jgi:hypothetical protein
MNLIMEFLEQVLNTITFGLGMTFGWFLGNLIVFHHTLSNSFGNAMCFLLGWLIGDLVIFSIKKAWN